MIGAFGAKGSHCDGIVFQNDNTATFETMTASAQKTVATTLKATHPFTLLRSDKAHAYVMWKTDQPTIDDSKVKAIVDAL